MSELITVREAARRNGITRQRVTQLIAAGRIPEAIRVGPYWALPGDWRHAPRPVGYHRKAKAT